MSREVRDIFLDLCRTATDHVFIWQGRPLAKTTVQSRFKRACERARVEGGHFHMCRHEFGSRLEDADVNLKKIQRLMGHSSSKMTEIYVHPAAAALERAGEVAMSARIVPISARRSGKYISAASAKVSQKIGFSLILSMERCLALA